MAADLYRARLCGRQIAPRRKRVPKGHASLAAVNSSTPQVPHTPPWPVESAGRTSRYNCGHGAVAHHRSRCCGRSCRYPATGTGRRRIRDRTRRPAPRCDSRCDSSASDHLRVHRSHAGRLHKRRSIPVGNPWSRPLGTMLDSTAVVAAERQGQNARQPLESVARKSGDEWIAVSVVTVLNLPTASAALTPRNAAGRSQRG